MPENPKDTITRRTFVGATIALYGTALTHGAGGAHSILSAMASRRQGQKPALAPLVFRPLPLGSVKARGWLLKQLELQRDGLTGSAEELLPATGPDSAWKGGKGEDWEKGPYYVKGLIPLAYTLDDETLKKRAQAWIEPILASQREDGFFGPKTNDDWWPRMVVTYLLRDYHEATNDPRVLTFLTRYYGHMSANLPGRPLRDWGRARAGDEMDTILWLYDRTNEESLLTLVDLLATQAYPWREIFTENRFLEYNADFHPKHNVNVPQAMKLPVVHSRVSGRKADRDAYRAGIAHLERDHGTSFGVWSGTEMLSGRSAAAGVETCSSVEYMLSAETAMRILGEARIGDELEAVAFNGLPAAMQKDFRQHVYYTTANNVAAVKGSQGYEQDYDDGRIPSPRSGYPCCCYNLHMGWPKLAQNAWATKDGGLAALVYVPSTVAATVADGAKASVTLETNYPFEESVRFEVGLDRPATFPLHLRVPEWCRGAAITVNGKVHSRPKAGTFAAVERAWKDGDKVELKLPMTVELRPEVGGAVSVRRGPLVYALALDESRKPAQPQPGEAKNGFVAEEFTTESPWNYALALDAKNPEKSFRFVKEKSSDNPFETGEAPVSLRVRGKRVAAWKARFDGRLPLDPPVSPVAADGPEQELTLVPFGSQTLRVSIFPVVGKPAPVAKTWTEDFSAGYERRWLSFPGVVVQKGRLRLPSTAKAVALRTRFADFDYEAEITLSPKGDAGLLFRASEPSIGTDHYRGYYLGLSAEGGRIVLGKSDNRWTEIATVPTKIEAGRTYRVRIEARGETIRVFLDGSATPVLEARDASFKDGSLGVRSYNADATFGGLSARASA